jgi:hypothetical protein
MKFSALQFPRDSRTRPASPQCIPANSMTDFPRHTLRRFGGQLQQLVLWLKIYDERSFQQRRLAHVGYSK